MSMSRVELEESEDKRDKEGAPGYRYQVSSSLSISTSLKSKKISRGSPEKENQALVS